MEYALQLLIPILLGLGLGAWLTQTTGASPMWGLLFAALGLAGGVGILYKKALLNQKHWKPPVDPKGIEPLRLRDILDDDGEWLDDKETEP